MAPSVPARPSTFDEYLRLEQAAEVRHELVGGTVHAHEDDDRRHNTLVGNIVMALRAVARGAGCHVYTESLRPRVAEDVVYYPDVVVTCDPADDATHMVARPCLVIEVASPSTAMIDRREKLAFYRRLPGLQAYLVVDQDRRRVERRWREADGWRSAVVEETGAVPVPCPGEGTALDLDVIYAAG